MSCNSRKRWWRATTFVLAAFACGRRDSYDPLDQIAAASANLRQRPLDICIDQMAYAPWSASDPADLSEFGNVATNIVMEAKKKQDDPRWVDAAGVVYLTFGQYAMATHQFQRATTLSPHEAIYWSHLAACHLVVARNGEPLALIEALAAADHALRGTPGLVSALFNRALILRELGLTAESRRAWLRCRDAGAGSKWASEAERRLVETRGTVRAHTVVLDDLQKNPTAIPRLVHDSPQDARANAELVFLNEWAKLQASDVAGAQKALAISRTIGSELAASSAESLLADAVTAIDRASDSTRALLSSAHQDYYNARLLFFKRRSREAEPIFRRAVEEFRSGNSAMALVAQYYVANCLYDGGQTAQAHAAIDVLLTRTPSRYPALRALSLWLRMSILTTEGLLNEALASGNESIDLFTRLGENDNASEVRSSVAGLQSLLGRRADAWTTRRHVFGALDDSGKTAALQRALNSAARTEALFGRWDTAQSLLTLSLEPRLRVNARLTSSNFLWRALAAIRAGDKADAERQFAEAETASHKIADDAIRTNALAEIKFGHSVALLATDPGASAALMTEFIEWLRNDQNPFLLPEAFLVRSRARRALGRDSEAIADLYSAIEWVASRAGEQEGSYGEAYFATARNARRELIDLLDRTARNREAFALLSGVEAGNVEGEHDSLIVAPIVLPDRLLVFVSSPDGRLRTVRVAASESTIADAVAEIGRCSQSEGERCAQPALMLLGRLLLQPVESELQGAKSIVIVPDDVLAAVPFAMLAAADEKPLIERLPVAIGTTTGIRSLTDHIDRHQSLLVISDPSFDGKTFPSLPRLPAANDEARQVAAMYPWPTVLGGGAATKTAVIEHLRSAEIVQIATHALVSTADPSRSCLVLASDHAQPGALYVHEIASMRLPQLRLVILIGCRTAVPSTAAAEGESIALAFIRSGAGSVIGSLWDIDDEVAGHVGMALHRELLAGATPAEALWRVQNAMLHSSEPHLRAPRAWAGLRLFVRGSRDSRRKTRSRPS